MRESGLTRQTNPSIIIYEEKKLLFRDTDFKEDKTMKKLRSVNLFNQNMDMVLACQQNKIHWQKKTNPNLKEVGV